jgi:hypothetical protein
MLFGALLRVISAEPRSILRHEQSGDSDDVYALRAGLRPS